MNLRSYDKNTRMLKVATLAANGISLQGENNVLMLGIIDCSQNGTAKIIENLSFGIRKENGVPLTFKIENFDYLQRITPATAKYARSYIDFVAKSTEAIARTNMLDGIVAIVDNNIMGLGVLEGCTKSNCPVLLMPVGLNPHYDEEIFQLPGKVAIRAVKSTEVDHRTHNYAKQTGTSPDDTLTTAFFNLAETFGLMLPGASALTINNGATLNFAISTGVEALKRADDIITTKRLISKKTLTEVLTQYKNNGGQASGVLQYKRLFELVDLKIPSGLFLSLKGTLADEAYVISQDNAPLTMANQAWVYRSITDAVIALTSNAIDNGIVVLQNCLDCDVSIVAKTIIAMQKQNEIALLTDGFCVSTPVLTVANISPNGFDNEDFANIQNGDLLEIDVTKGRLSTNATSKDMKLRAKRNIAKKYEIYF